MTIFSRAITALFLAILFLLLAVSGGPLSGWDTAVASWFGEFRAEALDAARWAAVLTTIGGAYVTLGSALVGTLWLLVRRMPRRALLLAATVLLERLSVELMKDGFGRPRPEVENLPTSLAFPSGHAANSMTAFLAIALIAVPAPYRRPAILVALAVSFIVGATRLVLGVHWASDVFGGWIFGLLAVGLAVTIGERSAALHLEAQHDIVARHGTPVGKD
ncbi:phosphatase PAP2 family protein [Sphingomonas sp. NSE70-1]|uniref:Phosphatase PAP2 family protein n=1 Tax=Sphingomonas caseinilyticus TaxID=2908205 RepID=A0ABT0RS86_9SPHN|nr:phosphatase PAP2 family protein [Sphingomonas caseinilyticus]MCL6697873.1 phosphatase PAP2 family protein [Sphingomonas caseinilyticus]